MLSLNDPMIKRSIIMDHYENPRNKEKVDDPRYLTCNMNSESCIDDIDVQILIENNIITDFKFSGVGCTISTASTSILSELVNGVSVEEARNIIANYDAMIKEEPYDELLLQEAVVFKDVSKQANRIKCAMIGFNGLLQLLDEYKAGDSSGK